MAFDLQKLAYLMHLYCDNREQCIYGNMGDIKVFFRYFSNDTTIAVRVFASPDDVVIARNNIAEFSSSHTGFTFIRIWEYRTTAVFTMPDGINEEAVSNELTAFVKFAADNAFVSRCSTCGSKDETRLYNFNHEGLCLCEGCSQLCGRDVEVTNALRDRRKPKYKKAVIAAVAVAVIVFLFQWYAGTSSDPLVSNFISGFTGTALSVFAVKKFAGRATKGIAAFSIILVIIATLAGDFLATVDMFTKFNKKQYEDSKFIVDYYESDMNDDEAFEYYISHPDKAQKISELFYMSDDELEKSYLYHKQITDNQTRKDVIRNFVSLIRSEYGDRTRDDFIELMWGGTAFIIVFGIFFWRIVVKTDGGRYSVKPLELDPFNAYKEIAMNGKNE